MKIEMFLIPFVVGRNFDFTIYDFRPNLRYGPTGNTGPTYAHQLSDWLMKSAVKSVSWPKNAEAKKILKRMENPSKAKWRNKQKRRLNLYMKHYKN